MSASRQLRMLTSILRANRVAPAADILVQRARFASFCAGFNIPSGVELSRRRRGGVPTTLASPEAPRPGLVVYLHGGAYQVGSSLTHLGVCARLALASLRPVLALDYRLAPEHRFPAPVEDVVAVYRALLRDGARPDELVLCGDSAGGGLALASLIALRDAGEPLPAGVVCLSPWTDLGCSGASMQTRAERDPLLSADEVIDSARLYLDGADPRTPLASPLYGDLRGLPPLLLQVGDAELLLDDSTRMAEAAQRAGVDVSLSIWPDAVHSFQLYDVLPEARRAMEEICRFVEARLPSAAATVATRGAPWL